MIKQCRCEYFINRKWNQLIDSVTTRHVFREVSYREVVDNLTQRDFEIATELRELLNVPLRDVIDVAVAKCNVLTPKEEWEFVFESEIVPIQEMVENAIVRREGVNA